MLESSIGENNGKSNEQIFSEIVSENIIDILFDRHIKSCFAKYYKQEIARSIKFKPYERVFKDEEKVEYYLSKKIYDGIVKIDKDIILFWKELDELSKDNFERKPYDPYEDKCFISYLSIQIGFYLFCLLLDDEYKFEIKEVTKDDWHDYIFYDYDEGKILKFKNNFFEIFEKNKGWEYSNNNTNTQNMQNETNGKLTNKLKEIIYKINLEEIINEVITSKKKIKYDTIHQEKCIIT